jgi:hypothetical protein
MENEWTVDLPFIISSSLSDPLTLDESVAAYNYQRQPNDNVQNIVNPGPKKIFSGRQMQLCPINPDCVPVDQTGREPLAVASG